MPHHPVSWFQIQGPNGKELQQFYTRVFEWKTTPAVGSGDMLMIAEEEGGISGGISSSLNGQPSVSVYVSVDDLESHLVRVHEAGGKLAMPPMDLPGGFGRVAGFTDPAGNWIGLWQPVPERASGGAKVEKAARSARKPSKAKAPQEKRAKAAKPRAKAAKPKRARENTGTRKRS